jgi:hypothetical protein
MKIIKHTDLKAIVGEMLNLEYSVHHWIDGEPGNLPVEQYYGYPRIIAIDNSYEDIITASHGVLYVPSVITGAGPVGDASQQLNDDGSDDLLTANTFIIPTIAQIIYDIEKIIGKMEAEMINPHGVAVKTPKYHTIERSWHTNVRIKSKLTGTTITPNNKKPIQRYIADDNNISMQSARNARFYWHVKTHEDFARSDNDIDSTKEFKSQFNYMFTDMLCSVFWDPHNLTVDISPQPTFALSSNIFRAKSRVLDIRVSLQDGIDPVTQIVGTMFNSGDNNNLVNKSHFEVYEGDYDMLEPALGDYKGSYLPSSGRITKIKTLVDKIANASASIVPPITISDQHYIKHPMLCRHCDTFLFGDNYAILNVHDGRYQCQPICVGCIHIKHKTIHPDARLLRIKYPVTRDDIINALFNNSQREFIETYDAFNAKTSDGVVTDINSVINCNIQPPFRGCETIAIHGEPVKLLKNYAFCKYPDKFWMTSLADRLSNHFICKLV